VKQSRYASFVEATTSTVVGFIVSVGVLEIVNRLWSLALDLGDNVTITCIFTVASIIRSYGVRRFFNWYHHRDGKIV